MLIACQTVNSHIGYCGEIIAVESSGFEASMLVSYSKKKRIEVLCEMQIKTYVGSRQFCVSVEFT